MRCRRQDSNLHHLSSELSASAMLRHDGTRIPDGEPGTRTLMSVTSAVFGTAALPIRLALHYLVLLFCYLYLPFQEQQLTATEAVGLEPTRDKIALWFSGPARLPFPPHLHSFAEPR